jgi:inosine-uridine nucleoside N-ribohydrolase
VKNKVRNMKKKFDAGFCGQLKLWSISILFFLIATDCFAQKQKVWVDADTGNETDDIYALARLLAEPSVEVVGVSSAHFNNADLVAFEKWNQYPTKNIKTVHISQQLNEDLLKVMDKLSIPHPIGADRQMGRAWGGREPRNSDAAREIIAAVKRLGKNEKLYVLSLGALTNIASAIALDTGIAKHIVCYALGANYNVSKGYWNKSEFNIRNDLNAFDYLLDNASVDLIIMPIDVAFPYRFKRDALYKKLSSDVPLEQMLKQRWEETNPQDTIRTLWDLALVEAFVKPEYAIIKQVLTPAENKQRMIKIYSKIDVQKMEDDFFMYLKIKN